MPTSEWFWIAMKKLSMMRVFPVDRTMKIKYAGVFLAVALALPSITWSHHSFAMFDRTKVVSLKGVVREFQWTNPHSWVQLTVKTDQGASEEWALEALSPNVLGRMGWKRNSIKAGDEITAFFNPTRDGSHGGNLVKVVLPDGKSIGGDQ